MATPRGLAACFSRAMSLSLYLYLFATWTSLACAETCIRRDDTAGVENPPKNFGMLLFPAFEPLDVFGSLDVLYTLSRQRQLNLYLIAETMAPVSVAPLTAAMNTVNSSFVSGSFPTGRDAMEGIVVFIQCR
jgi:hypothetical protein